MEKKDYNFIKMKSIGSWKVIDVEKTIKALKKLKKGRKLLKKY